MEMYKKNSSQEQEKDIELFSEYLSSAWQNFRLKNLAEKIKYKQYKSKPKMLYY